MRGAPIAFHITLATYGSRLHGSDRLTVDREHNVPRTPFLDVNPTRVAWEQSIMRFPQLLLTKEQQIHIEAEVPRICERGQWDYHIAAAAPDHVHALVSVDADGQVVRRLLKRWLSETLSVRWPTASGQTWWAEKGSVKPVFSERYFRSVFDYIARQRATEVR